MFEVVASLLIFGLTPVAQALEAPEKQLPEVKADTGNGTLRKKGEKPDSTFESLLEDKTEKLSKDDREVVKAWSDALFNRPDAPFDKVGLEKQKITIESPLSVPKDVFLEMPKEVKPERGNTSKQKDLPVIESVFGTFPSEGGFQPGNLGKWGSTALGSGASVRYSFGGPGIQHAWRTTQLRTTTNLDNVATAAAINEKDAARNGFRRWNLKADIFFQEVADPGVSSTDPAIALATDIRIVAGSDSPNNALGYASFPATIDSTLHKGRAGDIWINSESAYTSYFNAGSNSFGNFHKVVTHEIGHAIGLPHLVVGGNPSQIMEPGGTNNSNGELLSLDTQFARALYGFKEQRDLTGNQINDILLRNTTTGVVKIQSLGGVGGSTVGSEITVGPTISTQQWQIAAVGQFNSDYSSDILWRNVATGQNLIWQMNGAGVAQSVELPPVTGGSSTWKVIGAGDVDADRDSDIFWFQPSTGTLVVWTIQNAARQSTATLTYNNANLAGYTLAEVADINGDGWVDLIWRNPSTGGNLASYNAGFNAFPNAPLAIAGAETNYELAAIADYNRDGFMDFLWRDSAADASVIHYYQRGQLSGAVSVTGGTPSSGWGSV